MDRVTLWAEQNSYIKISMELYFNENGELYFDGYDIGKLVDEYWGDSDYEYTYTIEPDEVNKFYALFNLKLGDRAGLLQTLQDRFSVNEAYTLFGKFMNDNNINYKPFTWR